MNWSILLSAAASLIAAFDGTVGAQELPTTPEQAEFFHFVEKLDVSAPEIELQSSKGGTSAYAVMVIKGYRWGAILPENSATVIHGEVFAFELARALGVSPLVGPGKLYSLSGSGLLRFKRFLELQSFSGAKERNRKAILARIASNPTSLPTVVKIWGDKPFDYDPACKGNRLNMRDPIARFLSQNAPQPTDRTVSLRGVPGAARESDLARQLSSIMVMDALSGQWDRFSGGNLQAVSPNGTPQFIALDNGGAFAGDNWLQHYLSFLTRFDRSVAETLFKMNDFLAGKSPSFLGFTREAELKRAMSLDTSPRYWNLFKGKLLAVVTHINGLSGDKYFR